MADNLGYTPGSGAEVATDEIAGKHYQRVKIGVGVDGAAVDVSDANPMPVAGEVSVTGSVAVTAAAPLEVTGTVDVTSTAPLPAREIIARQEAGFAKTQAAIAQALELMARQQAEADALAEMEDEDEAILLLMAA